MRPQLRLRPVGRRDEAEFVAAHNEMATADGFTFGLHYVDGMPWPDYVHLLDRYRRGLDLPPEFVPGTFLVAVVGDRIVGRASIRHELNDFLAREGGHIGYGVLAAHRRRGHATEILRQSLIVARAAGVEEALLICDDDNTGSISVIERCGGELEAVVDADEGRIRRYWIP